MRSAPWRGTEKQEEMSMADEQQAEVFKDPRVRMKISKLSSGKMTYEATTRGDTVEEARDLLKDAKAELEKLTKVEEE